MPAIGGRLAARQSALSRQPDPHGGGRSQAPGPYGPCGAAGTERPPRWGERKCAERAESGNGERASRRTFHLFWEEGLNRVLR